MPSSIPPTWYESEKGEIPAALLQAAGIDKTVEYNRIALRLMLPESKLE